MTQICLIPCARANVKAEITFTTDGVCPFFRFLWDTNYYEFFPWGRKENLSCFIASIYM